RDVCCWTSGTCWRHPVRRDQLADTPEVRRERVPRRRPQHQARCRSGYHDPRPGGGRMTTFNVAYRTTVYVSRGIDPSETTLLTPIAGAPHSDPFKIATRTGISGFQPYMGLPSGRRGRIDLLSKKTDVGEITFDIIDVRTVVGGGNA